MKHPTHVIRVALAAVIAAPLALLAGCEADSEPRDPPVEAAIAEGRAHGVELAQLLEQDLGDPATAPPDELVGKLAAVAEAINDGEIVHAELALDRAQRTDTRLLAEQMIADHTAANLRLAELLARGGYAILDTPARARVEQEAELVRTRLEAARTGRFDVDFAIQQIRLHAAADELLGRVIAWPADPEVRTYLVDLRDTIREHLDLAIEIADALHGGG